MPTHAPCLSCPILSYPYLAVSCHQKKNQVPNLVKPYGKNIRSSTTPTHLENIGHWPKMPRRHMAESFGQNECVWYMLPGKDGQDHEMKREFGGLRRVYQDKKSW